MGTPKRTARARSSSSETRRVPPSTSATVMRCQGCPASRMAPASCSWVQPLSSRARRTSRAVTSPKDTSSGSSRSSGTGATASAARYKRVTSSVQSGHIRFSVSPVATSAALWMSTPRASMAAGGSASSASQGKGGRFRAMHVLLVLAGVGLILHGR